MAETETQKPLSRGHFTALLSMIMALGALAIDLMLPAFDDMRQYYGLAADSTRVAQVVTVFLLGMALAQFFYGPLADRFGRKPTLYVGFAIYALGALGALLSPSLEWMLVSRFVWGIGSAGPRVVAVSIVRDYYSGDEMSRAMSYIMAVFIMVPVLAPSIGAGLISVFHWQSVFAFGLAMVAALAVWARVLPETLAPENKLPIDRHVIFASTKEVLTNRQTFGYMMAMTMTFAVFSSYLASSERIFGDFYGRPDQFPLIFGGIAGVMGVAMLTNARLVQRIGAKRITHLSLLGYVVAALVFNLASASAGGLLSFWAFVLGMAAMVTLHALLIPNFNTIAMLPMGHIAGTASAVIGTVSLAIGALLGAFIDRLYSDSPAPLVIAFGLFGVLALAWVLWAEHGLLQTKQSQPALVPTLPSGSTRP